MASQLVQLHVNRDVREEASAVLAGMGLSVSDAIRLLLTRIAREKTLPFAPFIPNAETTAKIRAGSWMMQGNGSMSFAPPTS